MRSFLIGCFVVISIILAGSLFFSCGENPTGPEATATAVPQATATPQPLPTSVPGQTPQATATPIVSPQPTSVPTATATITPVVQATTFKQNFEDNNSTHGNYFTDSSVTSSSRTTAYRHDGAYSLRTTISGMAAPGGYVIIHCQEDPPVDISGQYYLNFWVLDFVQEAGHSVGLRLYDKNGSFTSTQFASTQTVYNTWTEMSFILPEMTGVDKKNITEVRIYMTVNGTFYFDGLESKN